MLRHEYYFCNLIDEDTWKDFLIQDHKGVLLPLYQIITGYGWKDKFGFNPDGNAFYIREDGSRYYGIWFETGSKKIAIFKR